MTFDSWSSLDSESRSELVACGLPIQVSYRNCGEQYSIFKTVKILAFVAICLLLPFGAVGQVESTPPKTIKLAEPTLAEELTTAEVEPRLGLFSMKIRFARANFRKPTPLAFEYSWNYFREANVLVNFSLVGDSFLSQTSAEQRKQKAIELVEASIREQKAEVVSKSDITVGTELGKQFNLALNGKTIILRTFADKTSWYLLGVELKNGADVALAEKLLNSFEFKKADATK